MPPRGHLVIPALALAALLCLFFVRTAAAQSSAGGGTIQGTVKDASGGVVPGAKISILHLATGQTTETRSNAEGYHATSPINIGDYRIHVEFTGMKSWEGSITLETGRVAEVNPTLTPGQVSETIQVTESLPLVTTAEATDASTLDAKRIGEIPVNGRNLNTLLENVTPGVEALDDVQGGIA